MSLFSEHAAAEMLREEPALFVVEAGGTRHAGSRDFHLESLRPDTDGFRAELLPDRPHLRAILGAAIDEEGLRLSLSVANLGDEAVGLKVAFPHLAGVRVSEAPHGDYYFYPWGGGIIADRPAHIRAGYGDHAAYYPIDSLDRVPGTSLACGYMLRTRQAGATFSPPDAVISAHPGDRHGPMARYSRWAHRVWRFRPYPSRMTPVVNWLSVGTRLNNTVLFRDGAYRNDLVNPRMDALELWCRWEWSELGPWRTPMEKLPEVIGEAEYERMQRYLVEDPVTGALMYPLNRGDYDGYNRRWGGLPALREAIRGYRDAGALLTLYTDPLLACDTTRLGQAHGREWGVGGPHGEHRKDYHSWRMCIDVAEYRRYVAETMERVLRETGADGIRLDEYGHHGYVCFSDVHQHTFAEPGTKEWMRALAESCRSVREGVDRVDPRSVLTTEMPGYDYMMQFLDGCITYDLSMQASPLRPLEVNLQRFYFPECRPFELDHRGRDPHCAKKLFSAVGSFARYYPQNMRRALRENADAFVSRDCVPLVPTQTRYVYANRFGGAEKTVWTVYNAAGHTVDGPVLLLDLEPKQHVFRLLDGREARVESHGDRVVVSAHLGAGEVACLARPTRRLTVRAAGDALAVTVSRPGGRGEVRASADPQAARHRLAASEHV